MTNSDGWRGWKVLACAAFLMVSGCKKNISTQTDMFVADASSSDSGAIDSAIADGGAADGATLDAGTASADGSLTDATVVADADVVLDAASADAAIVTDAAMVDASAADASVSDASVSDDASSTADAANCPDGVNTDMDLDGFASAACLGSPGGDCDDSNPAVHPGAFEVCNDHLDDDCNGYTDCADPSCFSSPSCT